jgi:hypothetical protein
MSTINSHLTVRRKLDLLHESFTIFVLLGWNSTVSTQLPQRSSIEKSDFSLFVSTDDLFSIGRPIHSSYHLVEINSSHLLLIFDAPESH